MDLTEPLNAMRRAWADLTKLETVFLQVSRDGRKRRSSVGVPP